MNMVLQVQRRDGEWIDADPIPNTVLINIADMMQRWTSDKLISAVYTVIMNNNNAQKYSADKSRNLSSVLCNLSPI